MFNSDKAQLINNPYLEKFNTYRRASRKASGAFSVWNLEHRDKLRKEFSYSVADDETVSTVASYCRDKPLIDIGAGTGYWSYLLDQMGIECHAYDTEPYENIYCNGHWYNVVKGAPEDIKARNYTSANVFLSWPPYSDPLAEEALKLYLDLADPGYFIYIGESRGNATGDDGFFDLLESSCYKLRAIQNPHYSGLHDQVEIYKKLETQ
jgi:hypothetical protein